MAAEFKMEGVSIGGKIYVLESDCRRTCNESMTVAKLAERERCAQIALAIDSSRGNEKEIAKAIRAQTV